ncbi:MAG: SBBP repeat-containing protein, partial [Actinomycetota bacterium]
MIKPLSLSVRLVFVGAVLALTAGGTLAVTTLEPDRQIAARPTADADTSALFDRVLRFERNDGQAPSDVTLFARGSDGSLELTEDGISFGTSSGRIDMHLLGADLSGLRGEERLPGTINYLHGSRRSWITAVPTFTGARYVEAYPGIDAVVRGAGPRPEYDFIVRPGADPSNIKLAFPGADALRLTGRGDLVVSADGRDLVHRRPTIYQALGGQRVEVGGGFRLDHGVLSFTVGAYDPGRALVIDPLVDLVYGTLLGGRGFDAGSDIAVDGAGNAYVTGSTADATSDFPATPGAFDTTHNGGTDAFVAKLDPSGRLVYATFLGGDDFDQGSGIAVDGAGNAYVTGLAFDGTTDFPTTGGAFQTTHNGSGDGFVAKLNPAGSALDYSTFLGGNDFDFGTRIAVDGAGNAYVTGQTSETGGTPFPTTGGAFDTSIQGFQDAFVTKLNPGGSAPVYSTFLGADGSDYGTGIAVDAAGSAYVAGYTGGGGYDVANNFPTTPGALQPTEPGNGDGFLSQFNTGGTGLVYSTFLGGGDYDQANGIA